MCPSTFNTSKNSHRRRERECLVICLEVGSAFVRGQTSHEHAQPREGSALATSAAQNASLKLFPFALVCLRRNGQDGPECNSSQG